MESKVQDLWPSELSVPDLPTPPVVVMRQQAALLGEKTSHLVEGKVETFKDDLGISHSFILVAPALDNYRYSLFNIHHGPELYPAYLSTGRSFGSLDAQKIFEKEYGMESGRDIKDYQQLVETLQHLFSSERTLKIINGLIAQSRKSV